MLGKKLLEEKPATSALAKKILVKREEEDLNYEQRAALDYLSKMSKLNEKKANDATKELEKSDKVKPEIAAKIVDLLPRDEDDVRAIFTKERFVLTKEEIATILKVIEGIS